MSKHHLRKSKDCLNCGTNVNERFCSHCGQENTETRQSFGHLARHFFEDLTHYDSGFWRTIKYLLFRPALLTKEYLAGKRVSYVPPVRLYIFISFLCFFLPAILPDVNNFPEERKNASNANENLIIYQDTTTQKRESFRTKVFWSELGTRNGYFEIKKPNDYSSIAQMDSMQMALPVEKRYNSIERWMAKKTIQIYEHNSPRQVAEKFGEAFSHNLSKVLFIYMPLFAFALWFFHSKKKWLYFDHAIFTLHYFSFMLLQISLFLILRACLKILPYEVYGMLLMITLFLSLIWIAYYFFRAHRKMYEEFWVVSSLKSFLLLFINIFFIATLFIGFSYYTLYTLH